MHNFKLIKSPYFGRSDNGEQIYTINFDCINDNNDKITIMFSQNCIVDAIGNREKTEYNNLNSQNLIYTLNENNVINNLLTWLDKEYKDSKNISSSRLIAGDNEHGDLNIKIAKEIFWNK